MISSPRERIWFAHTLTWLIVKGEVESRQVQLLFSLASIELLGHMKILEVLVIGPDLNRVASTFEVVSPLFESSDGQHLCVVNLSFAPQG
jgi:hypothetical protein